MVKPAVKAFSVASLAAPVALLAACSPPGEVPSDAPGTTPSVWTGSPAPATSEEHGGGGHHGEAAGALLVPINDASGDEVATATFDFGSEYVTITVETTGTGKLTPGFHGLHIHSVGKCEPNSVAPTGGAPGDFLSAGGHFHGTGHGGATAAGDLTSLQVREDGSGLLVTTTDAFTEEDLLAGEKTAIIIHEKSDNFGNIPPERYNQVNGTPGPDESTLTTGDAGKRVACGVIGGE
jgi:Cu-Zn family superoxide dismutase